MITPTIENTKYPWFISYLTQYLRNELGNEDVLYRGGLQIFTTLDPQAQQAAEVALLTTLAGIDPVTRVDAAGTEIVHTMQMAITAVEPPTGYVRAMVGGRDFGFDQTNIAVKGAGSIGRQAGLVLQALRAGDRLRAGRATRRDLLRAAAPRSATTHRRTTPAPSTGT